MLGVLIPAGASRDIVGRLNREIVRVVAQVDVKERLAALGFEPVANTLVQFSAFADAVGQLGLY